MPNIRFSDGYAMPWSIYNQMMQGKISPPVAVARARREPVAAYDAAMRRVARDQNGGKLDHTYCDATRKYLGDNGLPDEDVEAVMQILSKYQAEEAEDEENMEMGPRPKIEVGGARGRVGGASDRRMAMDDFGRPRALYATPMAPAENSGFARRFPEAMRIRIA